MLENASARRDELLKSARAEASAAVDRAHKEATTLKDGILAGGREEIAKEVGQLIGNAKQEAAEIKRQKISGQLIERAASKSVSKL